MITGLIIEDAVLILTTVILVLYLLRGLGILVRESGAAVFLWQRSETNEEENVEAARGRS